MVRRILTTRRRFTRAKDTYLCEITRLAVHSALLSGATRDHTSVPPRDRVKCAVPPASCICVEACELLIELSATSASNSRPVLPSFAETDTWASLHNASTGFSRGIQVAEMPMKSDPLVCVADIGIVGEAKLPVFAGGAFEFRS